MTSESPSSPTKPDGLPGPSGTARPRYRLYIDESGDHVYRDEHAMAEPVHRFLALCGCVFEAGDYVTFHDEWENLKRRHFPHSPDEPILIHRSDIINRRGPFSRLREREADEAFREDLVRVIAAARFALIVVAIDKRLLRALYPTPFHPYHTGFDFVLQKYCGFLNHANRRGDVMAESRGGTEDGLLKNAYRDIYARGDTHHKAEFYQRVLTSKELKLERKPPNIAGLQLADVLAYPLRQAILVENGLPDIEEASFGRLVASAAAAKYHRDPSTGRVENFGKVVYPRQ